MISKMFMDSGAFSLGPLVEKGRLKGEVPYKKWAKGDWTWYDSVEFKDYIDSYAEFIKQYGDYVNVFVNVDVLDDPERTYRNQRYIERKHGIRPVPVIHSFTDLDWIERYLEDGHKYIALGGMGGKRMHKRLAYRKWIDRVFTRLCPASNGYKPIVKTHGFAVTSWHSLVRYPWYSVDSTTYAKMAGYGWLLVPQVSRSDRTKFDFNREYIQIGVCSVPTDSVRERTKDRVLIKEYDGIHISPHAARANRVPGSRSAPWRSASNEFKHIGPPGARNKNVFGHVQRWLDNIGIPLGLEDGSEIGVVCDSDSRIRANLHYFDQLSKHLPKWPWAFRKGGGILL